jgi:hypothetical protein
MTWYITISSPKYLDSLETSTTIEFLKSTFNLSARKSSLDLVNQDPANFLSVIIAQANEHGSYSVLKALPEWINVIEMVCWNDNELKYYDNIALKIAAHLNWYARVENSDDDRIIYCPRN